MSTENLTYSLGAGEPTLTPQYPAPPCGGAPGGTGTIVIDDVPSGDNTYGCNDSATAHGTFKLVLGDDVSYQRVTSNFPTSSPYFGTWRYTPDIAQVDLHQLGTGYDGHMWFTHQYATNDVWHEVTAIWTPDPSLLPTEPTTAHFDVYVHLPSHGGQATVQYTGHSGGDGGGDSHSCSINQAGGNGSDTWKELGSLPLSKGAYLTADNLSSSGTGDADVTFDAIALVPVSSGVPGVCGWGH
ncbi:hypothetical protein [Streptantibioticus silvisoli]|uniref:Uncharacterized protein n=1 Tax=Streptantibioticus silvisoli TaxID=2705255 RepID=A0ABT6W571_9ACTN|nr:hypothetical protein [Streptantibioticus silvisoli]MDI5965909.1 hypothetical protein [Streptantibioticus silvisoli]